MRSGIDNYLVLKNKYPINTILKHKNCNLIEKIVEYKYDLFEVYVLLEPLNHPEWQNRRRCCWYNSSILKEYKII